MTDPTPINNGPQTARIENVVEQTFPKLNEDVPSTADNEITSTADNEVKTTTPSLDALCYTLHEQSSSTSNHKVEHTIPNLDEQPSSIADKKVKRIVLNFHADSASTATDNEIEQPISSVDEASSSKIVKDKGRKRSVPEDTGPSSKPTKSRKLFGTGDALPSPKRINTRKASAKDDTGPPKTLKSCLIYPGFYTSAQGPPNKRVRFDLPDDETNMEISHNDEPGSAAMQATKEQPVPPTPPILTLSDIMKLCAMIRNAHHLSPSSMTGVNARKSLNKRASAIVRPTDPDRVLLEEGSKLMMLARDNQAREEELAAWDACVRSVVARKTLIRILPGRGNVRASALFYLSGQMERLFLSFARARARTTVDVINELRIQGRLCNGLAERLLADVRNSFEHNINTKPYSAAMLDRLNFEHIFDGESRDVEGLWLLTLMLIATECIEMPQTREEFEEEALNAVREEVLALAEPYEPWTK